MSLSLQNVSVVLWFFSIYCSELHRLETNLLRLQPEQMGRVLLFAV